MKIWSKKNKKVGWVVRGRLVDVWVAVIRRVKQSVVRGSAALVGSLPSVSAENRAAQAATAK